jgi:hypothetical protein
MDYRNSIQLYKSSTRALNHPNRTMDMDIDCPNLPIRKYVEAVEDMDLTAKAPKLQAYRTSLSPFERLPLELRQKIYSYLGVPIARKFYSDALGAGKVLRYTFGHWDAGLAITKKYRYDGTACAVYYPNSKWSSYSYERPTMSYTTFAK